MNVLRQLYFTAPSSMNRLKEQNMQRLGSWARCCLIFYHVCKTGQKQQCQISLFVILQIRKQPRKITKRRTTTKRDKVQNEYRDKKQFKQFFPTIVQYLQNTCYFIHCASWTLWNSAVQLGGVRKASSPAIIFTTLAPSSDEMKTNFQASGWMLTESLTCLTCLSSCLIVLGLELL